MSPDLGAQMRKGVVEYCVLALLAGEPMYGWQLSESLTQAGLIGSIGTLYPLLARLRENEWVLTFDQPSPSGPARKYYQLSPLGRAQLALFRTQWMPFAASVTHLLGEDRDHD